MAKDKSYASLPELDDIRVAVIGLGYVGLPLAVEFAKTRSVIGFDTNLQRIEALKKGQDVTQEISNAQLLAAKRLELSSDAQCLQLANVFIVTVPTPIDANKRPNLGPLLEASRTVGTVLKQGDIVIYESTVYPGATEEECVPMLAGTSGLKFNIDFFVGYSPERVNPGDKDHRLPTICKVTSGSSPLVADLVDALYKTIITAGTHKAPSIRVAEAAKVIENVQRDINIALINELAMIFDRMNIDTQSVLEAAGTKWNFIPFRPGLVGGHCIGVDPYYLTFKAQQIGYHPEIILAGRRLNDVMGSHIAGQMVKRMLRNKIQIMGARVLVMGLAFKENCPDLRNTRVVDLIAELRDYGVSVDVHDPYVDANQALSEYGLALVADLEHGAYDGIILAVAHDGFCALGADEIRALGRSPHVLYDLKYLLPISDSDLRL